MNDRNDDTFLTDTLHRGVADVQTPFDTITSGSITAGRRLKRRRTAGVVLGSAACVAALSAGVVGVTHVLPGNKAVDPGFGAGPSETPSQTQSPTPTPDPSTTPAERGSAGVPVHLVLDGWTCEEFAIDEKSWCIGPDGVNGSVNWRPATEFDAWHGGDSDKTDDWVGPLHGKWFATVGLTERNPELARQVGEALVWE